MNDNDSKTKTNKQTNKQTNKKNNKKIIQKKGKHSKIQKRKNKNK